MNQTYTITLTFQVSKMDLTTFFDLVAVQIYKTYVFDEAIF